MYSRFIIITGMSGSGKSTALDALEDLGFYAVDNLPVSLLPAFVQMPAALGADEFRAAVVMDMRSRDFARDFPGIYHDLRGFNLEILFLEAGEEALLRRFSQTRRQHPMGGSASEGIKREKAMLAQVRELADQIIDTSRFNVHDLRREVNNLFASPDRPARMHVNLISFGYKYGVPPEADLMFDVRFLPNPYFIEELKGRTGQDKPVVDYIFKHQETEEFLGKLKDMLAFLLPLYKREGKSQLTVAIGCTGGKHRSVAVAGWLQSHLALNSDYRVNLRHRDIGEKT